jgi:DNA-binding transcriptional MerR regulator
MSFEPDGLRAGALATAAGVNVQTLRYYERRGLLDPPARTPGGHRLYPADSVALLRIIKAAQQLGFTLDEVADLLEAGRRRHVSGRLHERAVTKLAEIDRKLAHLQTIRAALADIVAARCDSLTDCTCPECPLPFVEIARPPSPT